MWFILIVSFRPLSLALWLFVHFVMIAGSHLLGKSSPLGFSPVLFYFIICIPFPFCVLGVLWNLIISVSDHCFLVNFASVT